jgi:SpoVK/Ycf46/Vps4 family AAA+-type ATPase
MAHQAQERLLCAVLWPKNYQYAYLTGELEVNFTIFILTSRSYSHARLLEVNSHSLFSKWFSESGKLVQRLFNSIAELADEQDAFLVVLIG